MVTFGGPHGARAAGLKFAIIRVSAEANDAQFAILGRGCDGGAQIGNKADRQQSASSDDSPKYQGVHGFPFVLSFELSRPFSGFKARRQRWDCKGSRIFPDTAVLVFQFSL
jgi:hypothetical protein